MKSRTIAVLSLLLALIPLHAVPAGAPAEADVLLSRHRAATGGEAAWAGIRTRRASGWIERNRARVPFVQSQQAPNRLRMEIFFPQPGTLAQGYDGTAAWVLHPAQGGRKPAGRERAALAAAAWLCPTEHLTDMFAVRRAGGPRTVEGRPMLTLQLGEKAGGPLETWFFDADTALLARIEKTVDAGPQGLVPVTQLFEDFRTVDGLTLAFRIRTRLPTTESVLQFEQVEHNVAFPDGFFAAPF